MGVKSLWQLLEPCGRRIPIEALRNQRLAVDASGWLYQFLKAMRDDKGELLHNAHLLGFLRRICRLLFHHIRPIFVFDGTAPALKRSTAVSRQRQRDHQAAKLRKAAEKLLLNRIKQSLVSNNDLDSENDAMPTVHQAEISEKVVSKHPMEVDVNVNHTTEAQEDSEKVDDELSDEFLAMVPEEGDLDPEVLSTLPTSMQVELLLRARERQTAANRAKFEMHAQQPSTFSEFQLQQYLKNSNLRRRLNGIQNEVNARQTVGDGRRIAAQADRQYVLQTEQPIQITISEKNRTGNVQLKKAAEMVTVTFEMTEDELDRLESSDDFEWEDADEKWQPTYQSEKEPKTTKQKQKYWTLSHGFQMGRKLGEWGSEFKETNLEPRAAISDWGEEEEEEQQLEEAIRLSLIPEMSSDGNNTKGSPDLLPLTNAVVNNLNKESTNGTFEELKPASIHSRHGKEPLSNTDISKPVMVVDKKETVGSIVKKTVAAKLALSSGVSGPSDKTQINCTESKPESSRQLHATAYHKNAPALDNRKDRSERKSQPGQGIVLITESIPNFSQGNPIPDTKRQTLQNVELPSPSGPSVEKITASKGELETDTLGPIMERTMRQVTYPQSLPSDNKCGHLSIADLEKEENSLRDEIRAAGGAADAPTQEMYTECQELLTLFGIPYIVAPGEAEAQCSWLNSIGLVDGVITDDNDAFLFGADRVLRHIFDEKRYVEEYRAADIATELGLNKDRLIKMALLLGSDYTEGVMGVGIVNAVEIVHAFEGDMERFKTWLDEPSTEVMAIMRAENSKKADPHASEATMEFKAKHQGAKRAWSLPAGFPSKAVIDAYEAPEIDGKKESFIFGRPDLDSLRDFCHINFGWQTDKTDAHLLPVLKIYDERQTQATMDTFLSFKQRFAKIRSKRLQKAIAGVSKRKSDKIMLNEETSKEKAPTRSGKRLKPSGKETDKEEF
jgi:5'-3' exonuclease